MNIAKEEEGRNPLIEIEGWEPMTPKGDPEEPGIAEPRPGMKQQATRCCCCSAFLVSVKG